MAQVSDWRKYDKEEWRQEGNRYQTLNGEWLFLYEHPVAGWLGGVPESALDALQQGFAYYLREEALERLKGLLARKEKLEATARFLFDLLRQSPPPHNWLRLPADSRPRLNRSTLAYHSLLVSGFACAMVRAALEAGKQIPELLRFQLPSEQSEHLLDVEELIHFTRVGALCHDFGKHPPKEHNQRGKQQVQQLFAELLDEPVVNHLSDIALRHHTSLYYRLRGETPLDLLDNFIACADTLASGADRPLPGTEGHDPVASATEFFRSELGDERALSLISADTDRVKSYVFETAKLPEVRGASALLTELNECEIASLLWEKFPLPSECLLYAAGGSALIVAPTTLAKDIAEDIQRLYLRYTGTATISVVHRPTSPQEWVRGVEASGGNFGNLAKWIGYDLRRAKESRAFYHVLDAPPHARRCDSCEVRPATQQMTRFQSGEEEKWVCDVCARKRKWGEREKSGYIEQFEDFLEDDAKQCQHTDGRYQQTIAEHGGRDAVIGAKTLEEIGKAADGKARGYVGVIYTDGNDIGSRIEKSETPAEYRTLSEELLRVTKEATFKALARRSLIKHIKCSDGQKRWIHPFEIVAIGGDDVFLIVPGDMALDIAVDLCDHFQSEFNGNLTMSAGVLIMREHLPIYYARSIVEALLKSAKRAGRKTRCQPSPAHIDFQVITGDSSLSEDVEEYRKQVYSLASFFKDNHRLIQRPYQLEDVRKLLCGARWVHEKKFPASQLYQLRQAVVEHVPAWAKNWYRYQLARAKDSTQEGNFVNFHQQLFGAEPKPFDDPDAPWRRCEGQWMTPVIDLVEIFNYVRSEKGGEDSETGN
jgi:hypothetical protein